MAAFQQVPLSSSSSSVVALALTALLLCLPPAGVAAAAGQDNCVTDASQDLPQILPCEGYVTSGNRTAPGSECCTPLRSVITDIGDCFCNFTKALRDFAATQPSLNQTRAIELLTLCNVTLPPNSAACLTTGGNDNAPLASGPSSSPSGNDSGGNSPSNKAPAPTSDAHNMRPSSLVFIVFLLGAWLYW